MLANTVTAAADVTFTGITKAVAAGVILSVKSVNDFSSSTRRISVSQRY